MNKKEIMQICKSAGEVKKGECIMALMTNKSGIKSSQIISAKEHIMAAGETWILYTDYEIMDFYPEFMTIKEIIYTVSFGSKEPEKISEPHNARSETIFLPYKEIFVIKKGVV